MHCKADLIHKWWCTAHNQDMSRCEQGQTNELEQGRCRGCGDHVENGVRYCDGCISER